MEVKRSPAFRIEALAFDGRRPGIRPVLAMVDAAAAEAGVAPAFTGDIAASIDYRRLAAGHTRCRVCRLYRSRLPGAREIGRASCRERV